MTTVRVCVPATPQGQVAPGWGRARTVAVATLANGSIADWDEIEVGWDAAHDIGSEGSHHARIARFLREHGVGVVVAGHMGPGMLRMLTSMGLQVELGAVGDARKAVTSAAGYTDPDGGPGER